jgi:hypothetical protein
VKAPFFVKFRKIFLAELKNGFIAPASTFDNVSGKFPIGFFVWDTTHKRQFNHASLTVYNAKAEVIDVKTISAPPEKGVLMDWLKTAHDNKKRIAFLRTTCSDFQTQNAVFITLHPSQNDYKQHRTHEISVSNFHFICIYFAVRWAFPATWINDRDQLLYPTSNKTLATTQDSPLFAQEKEVFLYEQDKDFQNDCLVFTLFHHQNRIAPKGEPNHWIPFTAAEVHAKDNFRSSFMSDYLKTRGPFTPAAQEVLDAGRELWTYYHDTIKNAPAGKIAYVDASLYEIREYFKERNEKGRLNTKSTDEHFNELDGKLRATLKALAVQIQPKVYEYGFLKD